MSKMRATKKQTKPNKQKPFRWHSTCSAGEQGGKRHSVDHESEDSLVVPFSILLYIFVLGPLKTKALVSHCFQFYIQRKTIGKNDSRKTEIFNSSAQIGGCRQGYLLLSFEVLLVQNRHHHYL